MYKLSIITITRNNLCGLQETVRSVGAQSSADFEYIVVEGAGTDGAAEWLQEQLPLFRAVGKSVRFISEPDMGIYNAMNKGLRMASGEYCLFLNSGDCLADVRVVEQVLPMLQGADVYYADALFCTDGQTAKRVYPDRLTMDFFYEDSLCHQAVFYHRNVLQSVGGYDETYRLIADWGLNVRLLRANYRFEHLPLVVARYDMHGQTSGTSGYEKCRVEQERFYRENGLRCIHLRMWLKRKWNQVWKALWTRRSMVH